jgi:hypothetical protein
VNKGERSCLQGRVIVGVIFCLMLLLLLLLLLILLPLLLLQLLQLLLAKIDSSAVQ